MKKYLIYHPTSKMERDLQVYYNHIIIYDKSRSAYIFCFSDEFLQKKERSWANARWLDLELG